MSSIENEKLLYAATLLLEYAGGTLQRTNLNKALFYLDLHWLLETGQTYTGGDYVALTHGPVLDGYVPHMINPLVSQGKVVEVEQDLMYWKSKRLVLREPAEKPTDEHLEVTVRRVAQWVSGQNAAELSDFSHDNIGWKSAIEKRNGAPINMVLALEQLVDDDPWIGELLSEEETKRLKQKLEGEFVSFE